MSNTQNMNVKVEKSRALKQIFYLQRSNGTSDIVIVIPGAKLLA